MPKNRWAGAKLMVADVAEGLKAEAFITAIFSGEELAFDLFEPKTEADEGDIIADVPEIRAIIENAQIGGGSENFSALVNFAGSIPDGLIGGSHILWFDAGLLAEVPASMLSDE